jgi:REP element-mobilizing transposase RayT
MSFTRRHLPHWIPDNTIIFVTWSAAGGHRWLADPRCARVVADALLYGRKIYDLHAWVVMPTHVHVVMTPKRPFPEIMRWLKWTTARRCNQLLNRNGIFWQDESFDHWVRNNELGDIIAYVEENPEAAGLADWPWSSRTVGQAILSPVKK